MDSRKRASVGKRRWLIVIAPGDVHLAGSEAELRKLLNDRPVTPETQVYEVGAGPRALREIPELARLLPQIEDSEPPIRQRRARAETRSPERVKLSEELAVLNRPLPEEIEYYDEVPRGNGKRALAALMLLAALGGAGYLLAQRHGGDDSAAASAAVVPAQAPAAEPAQAPAAVPAQAPAAEPVPAQAQAAVPARARAPVAPIAAPPATEAASSTPAALLAPDPEGDPPLPPRRRGR
ncbi:MAG TPA: hypothetical protein VIF57_14375 [Polyangia bacterium]